VELPHRSEESVSDVPDKVKEVLAQKDREVHITLVKGCPKEGDVIEHNGDMLEIIAFEKSEGLDGEGLDDMYFVYGYFYDFSGLEPQ
jgi:hypothetical protein